MRLDRPYLRTGLSVQEVPIGSQKPKSHRHLYRNKLLILCHSVYKNNQSCLDTFFKTFSCKSYNILSSCFFFSASYSAGHTSKVQNIWLISDQSLLADVVWLKHGSVPITNKWWLILHFVRARCKAFSMGDVTNIWSSSQIQSVV